MATLPFFGAIICIPRCGLGSYAERVKGYPRTPRSIGEHIRKRRLDLKLRQVDVAKVIGCDELTVVNWEKGHAEPSVNHMAGVVSFLGFNPLPEGDSLAQKLVAYRRTHGITQKRFAAQIGFDPGTLARWERGDRRPDKKQLCKLRQVDAFARDTAFVG